MKIRLKTVYCMSITQFCGKIFLFLKEILKISKYFICSIFRFFLELVIIIHCEMITAAVNQSTWQIIFFIKKVNTGETMLFIAQVFMFQL